MNVSASKLRENIYQLLDQVLETGMPLELDRKGRKLRIVPANGESKLARLTRHDCLDGDPDDIVHLDRSNEWQI